MKRIILGFFFIVIFFAAGQTYAQCMCANPGESETDEAKRSDAAFIGEVVEVKKVENVQKTEYKYYDVTFKVKESLKHDSLETIVVRNAASRESDFEEGETYLVFAFATSVDGVLSAAIYCCTHTRRISGVTKPKEESTFY